MLGIINRYGKKNINIDWDNMYVMCVLLLKNHLVNTIYNTTTVSKYYNDMYYVMYNIPMYDKIWIYNIDYKY